MARLYSRPLLVIKAIYCACLSLMCILLSSLISVEDIFVYLMLSTVPIGCLFTVPFWFTAVYLRKYRVNGIVQYVFLDAASCVVPAIFGVLCVEIVYAVIFETTVASGIITAIFAAIFVLVALVFWLMYFVLSRKK